MTIVNFVIEIRIQSGSELYVNYQSLDDVTSLVSRDFRLQIATSDSAGLPYVDRITVHFVARCGADQCASDAFCDSSDAARPTCVCRTGFSGGKFK